MHLPELGSTNALEPADGAGCAGGAAVGSVTVTGQAEVAPQSALPREVMAAGAASIAPLSRTNSRPICFTFHCVQAGRVYTHIGQYSAASARQTRTSTR
jgi:hypothetical protein